jgi:hypothetical protein
MPRGLRAAATSLFPRFNFESFLSTVSGSVRNAFPLAHTQQAIASDGTVIAEAPRTATLGNRVGREQSRR